MTRCLSCGANVTNLSLIPVIREHAQHHPVEQAYEMSSYGATLAFLQRTFRHVIASEYYPDRPPGSIVNGILNQDVQRLTFEDSSLDLITSNQVFEHVPDDLAGYAQCYRVLRPNGALIFSVPLYDIAHTKMIAELVDGEVVFHGTPEYHSSRADGPNSVLTFWHHSRHDICARLARCGFAARLLDVTLAPSQREPAQVVYAIKRC